MKMSGWGNYPSVESKVRRFADVDRLREVVANVAALIPRGSGRSYGDSALCETMVDVKPFNLFIDFDAEAGLLEVQAGVTLVEILRTIVPAGWFLKGTPGTRLITVGGAIASDVHGKDHHVQGCFSEGVSELTLMLADGAVVTCSRTENTDLFRATCGGMGLTGVILTAKLSLHRIASAQLQQRTVRTSNLEETFAAFERFADTRYSVAWVDGFAHADEVGRAVVTAGDFTDTGELEYADTTRVTMPFPTPSLLLNRYTGRAANRLYYSRAGRGKQAVTIDKFFYPLDAIAKWNRVYGWRGFTQYQFVLPLSASAAGIREALEYVAGPGPDSFLTVLKLCGPANDNYLSFPMEGYSLAMDFKISRPLFDQLNVLDEIVKRHGGRIYLTKDCRLDSAMLEAGYPMLGDFRALRESYGLRDKFQSLQSRRLDI